MWKVGLRWPGNRHLVFFSLGFLLVLAILNLSSFDFYNQRQGPAEVTEKEKEEYLKEEIGEGGSVISTVSPSDGQKIQLTLVELRDAAVEALRSCSACAPHRSLTFFDKFASATLIFTKVTILSAVKSTFYLGAPGWKGNMPPPLIMKMVRCQIFCTWSDMAVHQ